MTDRLQWVGMRHTLIALTLLLAACAEPCPPPETRIEYRTRTVEQTVYQTVVVCPDGLTINYNFGAGGHITENLEEMCAEMSSR